jgi:hypothetical protein
MRHKEIHRRVDDGVRLVELKLFGLIEKRVTIIVRNENCKREKKEELAMTAERRKKL